MHQLAPVIAGRARATLADCNRHQGARVVLQGRALGGRYQLRGYGHGPYRIRAHGLRGQQFEGHEGRSVPLLDG